MTTPVKFEIAKLLKEKGFGGGQMFYYPETKELTENHRGNNYPAPTTTEVVMWLWEKHRVWISVDFFLNINFIYTIKKENSTYVSEPTTTTEPTEAYEEAIEYALKNLI